MDWPVCKLQVRRLVLIEFAPLRWQNIFTFASDIFFHFNFCHDKRNGLGSCPSLSLSYSEWPKPKLKRRHYLLLSEKINWFWCNFPNSKVAELFLGYTYICNVFHRCQNIFLVPKLFFKYKLSCMFGEGLCALYNYSNSAEKPPPF